MEEGYHNNPDYPESELTRKLIGLTFEMWTRLGYGYQEKYYHRAYSELLKRENLQFQAEQKVIIKFESIKIGRYFIDFVILGKVVVEFKVAKDFYLQHIKQVLGYLKSTGMNVGLLILVAPEGIKIKRIVNTKSAISAN